MFNRLGHIFEHLPLKLLSLLIAIAMWWGVAHDPVIEVGVNAPIEFHNVPDNLEISSETIPQAQIRVRGPARVLRDLVQSEIHPSIDLQNAMAGERTYELSARQIQLPHEAEVVQIVPATFRVQFDARATKQVEVRPRVIGTFASGYRILQATAIPEQVTIVGPAKRVASIENAITDPVDASGVIGRATFTTHAYVSDPLVRFVNPGAIRIVVITEKSSSRAGVP
jgi:YbbR domain-containing protein